MSWLAADTGIHHMLHESEWGRGMDGYGCHYASGFGPRLINNSIEFGAILVLRQDTRFRRSHRTGVFPRIRYAATQPFLPTRNRCTHPPPLPTPPLLTPPPPLPPPSPH